MKLLTALQKENPFIMTAFDGRCFFLHKNDKRHTPRKNDRIVSIAFVEQNADKLCEIEQGIFELDLTLC